MSNLIGTQPDFSKDLHNIAIVKQRWKIGLFLKKTISEFYAAVVSDFTLRMYNKACKI